MPPVVVALALWLVKAGGVAFWQEHREMETRRVEAARYLCEQKGRCDALEAFAQHGFRWRRIKRVRKP